MDNRWNQALADSYRDWSFHIRFLEALGFRLRRHYAWLFLIHVACYAGKIIVHPTPPRIPLHAVAARGDGSEIG